MYIYIYIYIYILVCIYIYIYIYIGEIRRGSPVTHSFTHERSYVSIAMLGWNMKATNFDIEVKR